MTEHFNKLTPAEAERLAILAEECGEVVQAVGKILRHGYGSHNPTLPSAQQSDNRVHLEDELGDLLAVMLDMARRGDVDAEAIDAQRDAKLARLVAGKLYLHHQEEA